MRKLIALINLILISLISIASVQAMIILDGTSENITSNLQKGLVAQWTLDEEDYNSATNILNDKTPYSYHATNVDTTFTTGRKGNTNSAMDFNSAGDYITTTLTSDLSDDDFTISIWVKNPTNNYALVQATTATGATSNLIIIAAVTSSIFWFKSTTLGTLSTIQDGEWHNVVMVWDVSESKYKGYVDGNYIGQSGAVTGAGSVNAPIRLGIRNDLYTSNKYVGQMDEVRIYNRALSDTEVKQLYDSYKPQIKTTSLTKRLIFNAPLTNKYVKTETTGTEIVSDKTPYEYDLQNQNSVIGTEYSTFTNAATTSMKSQDYLLFGDTDLTFSAWIRPTTQPASVTGIIGQHIYNTYDNIGFGTYTNRLTTSIGYTDNTRDYNTRLSNYVLPLNQWTHAIMIYDATANSITYYVNGKFDKSWTLAKDISFTSRKIYIGRWSEVYSANTYSFIGDIKNARIYNRALSLEEIELLYDQGR